ncbi:MAG: hypothetical protein ACREOF_03435 [Gemmatimonadales bacterium]
MSRPARGRRGASFLGCLLSLALLGVAAWYGGHIGLVYLRKYQLVDEMKVNARHASGLPDETIRNRLSTKVREVFGPDRTMRFEISRPRGRQSIRIETQYRDSVDLPFLQRGFPVQLLVQQP